MFRPFFQSQTEVTSPGDSEDRTPGRLQAVWPPPKPKDEEEKVGLRYTEAGRVCFNKQASIYVQNHTLLFLFALATGIPPMKYVLHFNLLLSCWKEKNNFEWHRVLFVLRVKKKAVLLYSITVLLHTSVISTACSIHAGI